MLNNEFMLTGTLAKHFYENIAKDAPIYDFHCHLSAKEIYEDKQFTNISKIFLDFDHYKWRAMRFTGISEEYITGDAEDIDKFKMWGRTCERLIGSPLYHWTNMELNMFFNISEILKEGNAEEIYNLCNKKINDENLSPIKFIKKSKVKLICTTDDPTDSLKYHKLLAKESNIDFKVLPTFRPDKVLNILNDDFNDYIIKLSQSCSIKIETYSDLLESLSSRIAYFSKVGCRMSDHSLEKLLYLSTDRVEVEEIFTRKLQGDKISIEEGEKFRLYTLKKLAKVYHKENWSMQIHIGAMRNNNSTMYRRLGADSGFDVMNDFDIAPHLSSLLNDMNEDDALPKTILYTLNSKDNHVLSVLPHCFSEEGISGKIQFGAAWWLNDHKRGIYEHLENLGEQGMLAYFVGMLTDSRSFLSYARHDYFRRILCSYIGQLVADGEFESDEEILKGIIEGICFKNIKNYLELEDY